MSRALLASAFLMLVICVYCQAVPLVENPYLSMTINREDLGSGFNIGVDRQNTNLVVSGILIQTHNHW